MQVWNDPETRTDDPIHVEETVMIARPLLDVFQFVSDPTNDPKWRPDVVEARSTSEGAPSAGSTFMWIAKTDVGTEADMEVEIAEYVPHRRVRIRTVWGVMRPELTYLLHAAGQATRFTRVVDVYCGPPYMAPVMRKIIQARNAAYVANLKALLEAGAG